MGRRNQRIQDGALPEAFAPRGGAACVVLQSLRGLRVSGCPAQAGDLAGGDLEYLYSHTALAPNGSTNTLAGWEPDQARGNDPAC